MLKQTIHSLFEQIAPLINAEQVVSYAQNLAALEQRTDSESFKQAHAWLSEQYQDLGLSTKSVDMTCDGKTQLQSYQAPVSWTCSEAICQLKTGNDDYQVIADRKTEPYTAVLGTGHTGPNGVEGEVLIIESKQQIHEVDCKDKILVVGNFPPTAVRSLVTEKQALGIVSYYTEKPDINHEHVRWFNAWDSHTDGWLPTEGAVTENVPAISISPAKGQEIVTLAQTQNLKIKLVIEGSYGNEKLSSVFASTQNGNKHNPALITAHMYEPGLLDNASGVACALASASLLNNEQLSNQHKRQVHFFHGQECYSVMDASQKSFFAKDYLGHLNIDTVGDANQPFIITDGLQATDNFSGSLVEYIFNEAIQFTKDTPAENDIFEINCTLLADPLITGIATRGIGQGKCNSWHTSGDRPQHVTLDEKKIKVALLCSVTWAQILASADTTLCCDIAEHIANEFTQKVKHSADTSMLLNHYIEIMQSIPLLIEEPDSIASQINAHIIQMQNTEQACRRIDIDQEDRDLIQQAQSLFPKALIGGPASCDDFAPEDRKVVGGPKWNSNHIIYKSLADGKTSIVDICRKVNALHDKQKVSVKQLISFYQAYENAGFIKINT